MTAPAPATMLGTMNETPATPLAPSGVVPCPACGTPMAATEACPNCGHAPDPRAARLVAVDRELAGTAARLETTRRQFDDLSRQWNRLSAERHELVGQMRAAATATRTRQAPPVPFAPVASPPVRSKRTADEQREPQTIQNLLFIIGGILLGVGAIVFTIVAWSRYGMAGRIAILAAATLIALAIPLVAMRNRLQATAETFTAIGLLLLGLDGFGLWRLDAFGIRDRCAGSTYAAGVLAVVAAVAFGYGRAVRLTGPRFVAIVIAQPVLPLLTVVHHPDATFVAAVLTVVATLDFLVAAYYRTRAPATMVVSAAIAGLTLAAGSLTAFVVLLGTGIDGPLGIAAAGRAAAVIAGAATVLLLVGVRAGDRNARNAMVAAAVLEVIAAAGQTARIGWHGHALSIVAALTVAAVACALGLRSRERFAGGTAAAAWAVAGVTALVAAVIALGTAVDRVTRLHPTWHTDLRGLTHATLDPSVPVAITVGFLGCALLAGRGHRRWVTLLGAVPLVLAVGALDVARWWMPPVVDELGVAALVALAAVHLGSRFVGPSSPGTPPMSRPATVAAIGAAVLALHAVISSLARADLTGGILTGIVAIGIAATVALRRNEIMAGCAFATAMVAMPWAAASFSAAHTLGPVVAMRVGLCAVAVEVVAMLAIRRFTFLHRYATVAISIVAILVSLTPLAVTSTERLNLYAMTGRLLITLAVLAIGMRGRRARLAMLPGDVLGLLAIGRILPVAATVLIQPYAWVGYVWHGNPSGTGITPLAYQWRLDTLDILTAVLFAASLTLSAVAMRGRRGGYEFGLPAGSLALLVVLAATGASWPAVPVASLVLGLAAVLGGLGPVKAARSAAVASCGVLFVGAGLAGLLATKASTMAGLGAIVVTALVIGAVGRSTGVRACGWVAAVVFADLLAIAAIRSGGAGLDDVSFGVLGASALASLLSPLIRGYGRSETEMKALDAIVHGGVFVALTMSGSLAHAAIIACGWGVLVGVRARSALLVWTQRQLTIVACGLEILAWWLLAADRGTYTVELYSVPFAMYAYLTGAYVHRRLPALGSWITYAPGLLAGFLPSLVLALAPDPSVVRRLILGGAAVAVVLFGARYKLHAHVIIGGWVAVILALREIVLVWQHLSAWIPLTVAGLLLITVAITYERRRRDWARLRASLKEMA